MSQALLVASALVPALLFLWFLCSRDRNPEPPGLVIRTFLLGALVTVPIVPVAMALEALGHGAMGVWGKAIVGAFLGAAIPEEGFKFLVLRLWVWRQKDFDEPMDGIVYGAAASLGFAALENVMYVSEGGLSVATLRAVTAVPGHALTGVLMGYYAGRAKFGPPEERTRLLVRGLGAAIVVHGAYDMFLLTATLWAFLALPVLLLQLLWARRLIAEMRAEQFATFPAEPIVIEALPAPTAVRSGWALAKILVGGAGVTLGGLFLLGCALALADPKQRESAALMGALIAVSLAGTAASLALFRAGLRGPFVEPAS